MSTTNQYAKSIAETVADYRSEELDPFDADYMTTWAEQFDEGECLPVLAEMDHILKKTYFFGDLNELDDPRIIAQ